MTFDPQEPILESMLDEMLGQESCPDFTDRVRIELEKSASKRKSQRDKLAARKRKNRERLPADPALPLDVLTSQRVDPEVATRPTSTIPAPSRSADLSPKLQARSRQSQRWLQPIVWMACGAASVIGTLLVVDQLWLAPSRSATPVSNSSEMNSEMREGEFVPTENADSKFAQGTSNGSTGVGSNNRDSELDSNSTDLENNPNGLAQRNADGFRMTSEGLPFGQESTNRLSNSNSDRLSLPTPRATSEIVTRVNYVIDREIRRQQVTPQPPVSYDVWLDRVALVLLGRPATAEELEQFTAEEDTAAQREKVVDTFLTEASYREEYARHWSGLLAQDLIPVRSFGKQAPDSKQRDSTAAKLNPLLQSALETSLSKDSGLDQVAFELLTATGSSQTDADDFNPYVAFIGAHSTDRKQIALSDQIAGYFLGRRLDCARCHDHVAGSEWSQKDYWQFNGFLRQLRVRRLADSQEVVVKDGDFRGDHSTEDAAIVFEASDGRMVATYPTFNGEHVTISGEVAVANRRVELANRLVKSSAFRRVMVNRIWAHVFGAGMTRPIDDFEENNPISHPTLLDSLSGQWAAHDHRLRPLLKWLVLSRPFSRPAEPLSWQLAVDAPRSGHRPLFSQFYWKLDQELSTTQSLGLILNNRQALASYEISSSGIFASQSSLNVEPEPTREKEDLPEHAFETMELAQAEKVANAFLLRSPQNPWGVSNKYSEILDSLSTSDLSQQDKLTHLFLTAISREPTAAERRQAELMLRYQRDNPVRGMQDVWWALMLSNEFAH